MNPQLLGALMTQEGIVFGSDVDRGVAAGQLGYGHE